MILTLLVSVFTFLILYWLLNKSNVDYNVIHLSYRTDRLKLIHEMEKRIGRPVHIFKATGPSVLEGFKPGEVGCYQSHMRILNTPRDTKYSVIFEDDFVVHDDFHSKVQKILKDVEELDFDILYLGNLDGNHATHVKGDVYTVDSSRYLTGMHGYLVKNENTWKITSQLHYKSPIDLEIPELIKSGSIKALVVFPSIVYQNPHSVSSIRVS